MKVTMLVKNSFEYDARVAKEAGSLLRAGHEVTVVAIHVPGVTPRAERRPDGLRVVRVPRIYGPLIGLVGASTVIPGAGGRGSPPGCGPGRRFPRARPAARAATVAAKPALFVARVVNAVVLNRRFAAAALRTAPDVVHAHDLNTLHPATVVARRCGARLVYDAHELAVHRNGMGPLRRAWARAHERSGLRAVDAMITTTDAWADYLAGVYRIPRPVVVRNVPEPLSVERNDDLRTKLDIRDDRRILLYQGSIQPNRGIEQIIDALALLPECVLVVVGYGAHRPVLERAVADRGLTDRVRFFGPVPNDLLLHYTAGVDVGMCCIRNSSLSYYWSLPNKLFEYMMAGVPCVASDFPEMGRIVRTEDVGEVCDPDDPASIAAAVARIVRDRACADRHRLSAASATLRYNWAVEERLLRSLYHGLDAGAGRGRRTARPGSFGSTTQRWGRT